MRIRVQKSATRAAPKAIDMPPVAGWKKGQLSATLRHRLCCSNENGKLTQFESFALFKDLEQQDVVSQRSSLSGSSKGRIPHHTPYKGRGHHPAPSESQDSLPALPGIPSSEPFHRVLLITVV